MSRTPLEEKLKALNKELRELLHKKTPTKAERKRINQIHGTLLPNVRKQLEEQRR
jgi:uncharacterized protein with ATP-grasp and redox domains